MPAFRVVIVTRIKSATCQTFTALDLNQPNFKWLRRNYIWSESVRKWLPLIWIWINCCLGIPPDFERLCVTVSVVKPPGCNRPLLMVQGGVRGPVGPQLPHRALQQERDSPQPPPHGGTSQASLAQPSISAPGCYPLSICKTVARLDKIISLEESFIS